MQEGNCAPGDGDHPTVSAFLTCRLGVPTGKQKPNLPSLGQRHPDTGAPTWEQGTASNRWRGARCTPRALSPIPAWNTLQRPLAALLGLAVLLSSSSQDRAISKFPSALEKDGPFHQGNAARKMVSDGEGNGMLWG